MDHETSANLDVEGPSTPVNVYGSPVAPQGRRNEESIAAASHAVPFANVTRVVSSILHFTRESFFKTKMIVYNIIYFVLS